MIVEGAGCQWRRLRFCKTWAFGAIVGVRCGKKTKFKELGLAGELALRLIYDRLKSVGVAESSAV